MQAAAVRTDTAAALRTNRPQQRSSGPLIRTAVVVMLRFVNDATLCAVYFAPAAAAMENGFQIWSFSGQPLYK